MVRKLKSDKSETQCKQAEKAERRRVEEALKKSEENYRELANCISDPFFALNKDMRFTYWNRASETNTGILADSIIGKYLFDVFPELKGTQIERAYNEAIATCKVQFLENNRWEQQGGAVTYHDVSIYPTADGIAVFSRDVTERKRAEEALYESEKKFIKIFQGNAAAIALTQLRDGCIIEVNERWQEVFGFSREEVIGKSTMDEIKVWKNPEERTLAIRDLEMHGAFRNRECDFIRKSGEAWTALMSSEVIQLLG